MIILEILTFGPLTIPRLLHRTSYPCAGPESFFSDGVHLEVLFIQIPIKPGHHRTASETPFKWRFAGMPLMAQH